MRGCLRFLRSGSRYWSGMSYNLDRAGQVLTETQLAYGRCAAPGLVLRPFERAARADRPGGDAACRDERNSSATPCSISGGALLLRRLRHTRSERRMRDEMTDLGCGENLNASAKSTACRRLPVGHVSSASAFQDCGRGFGENSRRHPRPPHHNFAFLQPRLAGLSLFVPADAENPVYLASADYRPPRGDVEAAGAPAALRPGSAKPPAIGWSLRRARRAHRRGAHRTAGVGGKRGLCRELDDLGRGTDEAADPTTVGERFDPGRWRKCVTGGRHYHRRRGAAAISRRLRPLRRVKSLLVRGAAIKRENAAAVQGLQADLGLYADVAGGARHPVEHDDAVGLALREIQGKADAGFITAEDAGRIAQSSTAISPGARRDARSRPIRSPPSTASRAARISQASMGTPRAPDGRGRARRAGPSRARADRAAAVRRDTPTS